MNFANNILETFDALFQAQIEYMEAEQETENDRICTAAIRHFEAKGAIETTTPQPNVSREFAPVGVILGEA